MKWVGLTGGIGSGKSSVTKLLRKHGVPVIDADALAREVVEVGSEGLADIVKTFGAEVLNPDGSLDRAAMAKRVFGDPNALKTLEQIIHPLIQAKVQESRNAYQRAGMPVAVYDVPLLFEKKLEAQFDALIVVWTGEEDQIRRTMARDGLSREEVMGRLNNQIPLIDKKGKAHLVIDNSGDLASLEKEVLKAIAQLRSHL